MRAIHTFLGAVATITRTARLLFHRPIAPPVMPVAKAPAHRAKRPSRDLTKYRARRRIRVRLEKAGRRAAHIHDR